MAVAQPLVINSQRFTFRLPGQTEEVVQPLMPAVIDRNGSQTQTINGKFGGNGTVQTDGAAQGSASWTSTSIAWSANASIASSIIEAFEVDDYAEYAARAQVITEVRFQVLQAIEVQLTRGGTNGTSSGGSFVNDFGLPTLFPLDSNGDPIGGQGVVIGFNDPSRMLQPGQYLAWVRTAAVVATNSGNPPVAGSAMSADGATLVVVPGPGSLPLVGAMLLVTLRRRR